MKSNPSYDAAKHGDYNAAKKLVSDLVKKERITQLKEAYPDAIVAPISSAGAGHNQIPDAYADLLGENGFEVDHNIKIVDKANRTGKGELERLTSQNKIEGSVKEGAKYIIVDDVVTSGASINEYRQYIEDNGGCVVACSTMCMGQAGNNQIAPTKESIEKAVSKHGQDRIDKVCKAVGAKNGIESLTNWQVNYLRSCNSDTLDKLVDEMEK